MDFFYMLRSKILGVLQVTQFGLVAPLLLITAFGVYAIGEKAQELVSAIRAQSALQSTKKPQAATVDKKPLSASELEQYQQVLARLHPMVVIGLTGDKRGLTVAVGDPRQFNEWMFALYSLQSNGKNVLWDVSKICLKKCNSVAAIAEVQGYRQFVRFK